MSAAPLVKIKATTAVEVCANFEVSPDAWKLMRQGMAPGEFVAALLAKKQYIAGIAFLAHAMPPRESIWWGCLCMRHVFGDNLSPPDRAAAIAAVNWVLWPTEEHRAGAKAPADAAGPASPAGSLAVAAFQTGGNVAPPKSPAMAPQPFAWARAVVQAVKLCCAKSEPIKVAETQRQFLELGVGIAEGRYM